MVYRSKQFMLAVAVFSIAIGPAAAQTTAYKAPRTPDGKPNLNGIWQAMGTANWDLQGHSASAGPLFQLGAAGAVPPGPGVVEGDQIPYLPAALMKKKENFANRLQMDPEIKCYMPGCRVPPIRAIHFRSCNRRKRR
jgi:hypothetical protein